ncbi:MAG: hypothetical protein IJN62_05470 [Clostridia bacterium]|nr:hypothetical protein [Clostridia bacterium]
MKKIISILLAILMLTTSVSAAELPALLTEVITNYTADYSISVTFDSSEEIAALLDEIEFSQALNNYVDVKSLLRTLLAYDGTMRLQADISDDYKKIKLALTAESEHDIDVNSNLNVGINAKMGMWINMDLSNDEAPVFDIIYSYPFLNKYMKMTIDDIAFDETALEKIKSVFDKNYMDSMQKIGTDLLAKHSQIELGGSKYIIKMDNNGLTSYIDELMSILPEIMSGIAPEEDFSYFEFPSVKGWQILGKDGMRCVYNVSGNKLKSSNVNVDISVDIAQIYKALTGGEWIYESDGLLDFTINIDTDFKAYGVTKVEFPVLTDENSFTLTDMGHQYIESEEPADNANTYPVWYVSESCGALPIIDGEIYVPLRQTIEAGYFDSASIEYNNGNITLTSEFFPGYTTLEFAIDSTDAYTDGAKHAIAKPILVDGTTYVSNTFFSDMLGWEFTYAEHNLLNDYYHYTFYTTTY